MAKAGKATGQVPCSISRVISVPLWFLTVWAPGSGYRVRRELAALAEATRRRPFPLSCAISGDKSPGKSGENSLHSISDLRQIRAI
jgi:hypothetical protein